MKNNNINQYIIINTAFDNKDELNKVSKFLLERYNDIYEEYFDD